MLRDNVIGVYIYLAMEIMLKIINVGFLLIVIYVLKLSECSNNPHCDKEDEEHATDKW